MQVRSCAQTCASYIADYRILSYVLIFYSCNCAHVSVKRFITRMMGYNHVISVSVVKTGRCNFSVHCRIDSCSLRTGHIYSAVIRTRSCKRRFSPSKSGRQIPSCMHWFFKQISVNFLTGNPIQMSIRQKEHCSGRKRVAFRNLIYCAEFCIVNLIFFSNRKRSLAIFAHCVQDSRNRRNF